MDCRNLKALKDYLTNYKLPEGHKGYINILLFGMVGAGKSSVINTFLSALDPDGRTITCVPTGNEDQSLTTELRSYKTANLKFWDTAGWNAMEGLHQKQNVLLMILEGRVPVGTNLHDFNPTKVYPVIPGNAIHGVAFIFDIITVDVISLDKVEQFRALQSITKNKNIHSIMIGTKFELLGIQAKHHAWIYEYKPLQLKFKKLAASTRIRKHCMFVVSNQWNGDHITMIKCILALWALENLVRNIGHYL